MFEGKKKRSAIFLIRSSLFYSIAIYCFFLLDKLLGKVRSKTLSQDISRKHEQANRKEDQCAEFGDWPSWAIRRAGKTAVFTLTVIYFILIVPVAIESHLKESAILSSLLKDTDASEDNVSVYSCTVL